jgi:hypothetical protein
MSQLVGSEYAVKRLVMQQCELATWARVGFEDSDCFAISQLVVSGGAAKSMIVLK